MGDYYIWRDRMSEQINVSALKQTSASKIQIEVMEIAPQTMKKNNTSQLGADADGSDLSNEQLLIYFYQLFYQGVSGNKLLTLTPGNNIFIVFTCC